MQNPTGRIRVEGKRAHGWYASTGSNCRRRNRTPTSCRPMRAAPQPWDAASCRSTGRPHLAAETLRPLNRTYDLLPRVRLTSLSFVQFLMLSPSTYCHVHCSISQYNRIVSISKGLRWLVPSLENATHVVLRIAQCARYVHVGCDSEQCIHAHQIAPG